MVKINDFDNTGKFLISIVNFDETTDRFLHVGINVQSRIDTFDIIDAYQDWWEIISPKEQDAIIIRAKCSKVRKSIFYCEFVFDKDFSLNTSRLSKLVELIELADPIEE